MAKQYDVPEIQVWLLEYHDQVMTGTTSINDFTILDAEGNPDDAF